MNAMHKIERLTPESRRALFQERANVAWWAGKMTRDEYLTRTERIFTKHAFGTERIRTHRLVDAQGTTLSSADVLEVTHAVQLGDQAETLRIPLITSLNTPQDLQKRGYGAELMRRLVEEDPREIVFIYSDIGTKFYEKLGYVAQPLEENIVPTSRPQGMDFSREATPISGREAEDLGRASVLARLNRANRDARRGAAIAAALPDELFTDWHLERYRAFCDLRGREFPGQTMFKLTHASATEVTSPGEVASGPERAHAFVAAPDPIARQMDVLWMEPECEACQAFAHNCAAEWEMPKLRYWAGARSPRALPEDHPCVPMLLTRGQYEGTKLLPPQLTCWF